MFETILERSSTVDLNPCDNIHPVHRDIGDIIHPVHRDIGDIIHPVHRDIGDIIHPVHRDISEEYDGIGLGGFQFYKRRKSSKKVGKKERK